MTTGGTAIIAQKIVSISGFQKGLQL